MNQTTFKVSPETARQVQVFRIMKRLRSADGVVRFLFDHYHQTTGKKPLTEQEA